jgi:hypothetical protein
MYRVPRSRVRPQLGGDQLLRLLERWLTAVQVPFFDSQGAATALGKRLKYTSNALGRLHRKGLLKATQVTRLDRRGMRHGCRYIYQISREGYRRLRYLERRSWIPNHIYLGSYPGDLSQEVRLEFLRPFEKHLRKFGRSDVSSMDRGPARTDLGDFLATIDPGLLSANISSKVFTAYFPGLTALYWPSVLQYQGLIPPEINVRDYCLFENRQGISNKEIAFTLLYRGAKRLAAENRVLKDKSQANLLKEEPARDSFWEKIAELKEKLAFIEGERSNQSRESSSFREYLQDELNKSRDKAFAYARAVSSLLASELSQVESIKDPNLWLVKRFAKGTLQRLASINDLAAISFLGRRFNAEALA